MTRPSQVNSGSEDGGNGVPDPHEILYVPIDVAKYEHKAMIYTLAKEEIEPAFAFNIYEEGMALLRRKVEGAARRVGAKKIVVGLEATGHYHETLVQRLRQLQWEVTLINPYDSFKTRALAIDFVKTDEIDLKAIFEAMALGKGRKVVEEAPVYRKLRLMTRFRRARVKQRSILKTQMLRDLDRLWPGLSNKWRKEKGLFTDLWEGKFSRALLSLAPSPVRVRELGSDGLLKLFRESGVKRMGRVWAAKIVNHALSVVACAPEEAEVHEVLFRTNWQILEQLNGVIEKIEEETAALLWQTPGGRLLSIKGVSAVTAAEFVAEVGDIAKFKKARQLVKLAGLHTRRYQTGMFDSKKRPITKVGNAYLRATAFTVARNISRWEGEFKDKLTHLLKQGKHFQVALGGVATKFMRCAFHLLKENRPFETERPALMQN